jgi:hypothetical protein
MSKLNPKSFITSAPGKEATNINKMRKHEDTEMRQFFETILA